MPCQFARQFGYDQLYVGNPNPSLCFSGNLFEDARSWYYSIAEGTGAVFILPHKMPNSYASFGFCSLYFMVNKVPGFEINTSCIKGIKSTYKAKVGSKGCRMQGLTEYQETERKAEREARRETSRTRATLALDSGAGAAEEHPIQRTQHAVPKRPRVSASQGEPSQKKAKKGSEAKASAWMPKVIHLGAEEQEGEEEEEEEAIPTLHPRGLRSRCPAILAEGEPAANPLWLKGLICLQLLRSRRKG